MSCSSARNAFPRPPVPQRAQALISESGSEVEPSRPPEVGAALDRLPSPAAASGECIAALTGLAMALGVLQEPRCTTERRGGMR